MPAAPSPRARFPNAVVVHANFTMFRPGQTMRFASVESRMALWCKAGMGTVSVNGASFRMEAGRYLVLPWRHSVRYAADCKEPLFLGGVHIIPDHAPGHKVTFSVAHDGNHPLARAAFRRDAALPGLPGLKVGWLDPQAPLTHLLEYLTRVFIRGNPEEWAARHLAQLLLAELDQAGAEAGIPGCHIPPDLDRIRQFIESNPRARLSLRDVSEFIELSPSTVGRLFRRHLKTTPVAWIIKSKMERAETLLRTERLPISEIAARVGIPDPRYFSKCFKQKTGFSPLQWRRQTGWI